MSLPASIRHYYLDNFEQLPNEKQFHFATRLAAWDRDPACTAYLDSVASNYVKAPEEIREELRGLIEHPPGAKINAAAARQPYFEKYPGLRGLMLALFRVRHLLAVYSYDARDILLEIYPLEKMHALADQLLADEDALRILSTYAINYLYLVDHILYPTPGRLLPVGHFYELGSQYGTDDPEQIQLMIYFYTHCIIGASNFYTAPLPHHDVDMYRNMLERLEKAISQNFQLVNLDNKFEFLVCARIVGFSSQLHSPVLSEAEKSLSDNGTFVIDTHNEFRQSDKTSFADSEHRNVLFVMSASNYHSQPSPKAS